MQRTQNIQCILKKNTGGELTLPNFKIDPRVRTSGADTPVKPA